MAKKSTSPKRSTTKAAPQRPAKTKAVAPQKAAPAKKANAETADDKPAEAASTKTPAAPGDKKISAIDAAAKVLADSKQAMNCKELIEAMATQGLWTSPGGKTPAATLYSAVLREIKKKGNDARFVKTERGKFTANA